MFLPPDPREFLSLRAFKNYNKKNKESVIPEEITGSNPRLQPQILNTAIL